MNLKMIDELGRKVNVSAKDLKNRKTYKIVWDGQDWVVILNKKRKK